MVVYSRNDLLVGRGLKKAKGSATRSRNIAWSHIQVRLPEREVNLHVVEESSTAVLDLYEGSIVETHYVCEPVVASARVAALPYLQGCGYVRCRPQKGWNNRGLNHLLGRPGSRGGNVDCGHDPTGLVSYWGCYPPDA